jgi:serine/threonine-protein kinase
VVFNPFNRTPAAAAPPSEPGADSVAPEFAATVATLTPVGQPALSLRALPEEPAASHGGAGRVFPGDSVPSSRLDSVPDSGVPDVLTDFGVDSLPAPAELSATQTAPTLQHIGRYALKAPLGLGGLGQVHEAWDPLLSRTVAVKTLQFDIDTPTRVSLDGLFLNEARAAAGLSHPHIVTVFDAGLSAHGVYIAMERLRGRDLRQALAAGWRPSPLEAALLVRRVADALAYAHAKGVVHCDIKPANIFLTKRDKPKVLDFGIARVAHARALPGLEELVMGSPHYLAPEQLSAGEITARTDIHALGVVLYELLSGRKAFEGDSVEQISTAVLHAHPAPAHDVAPGVPPALSAIAARAMARDPADRYGQADEMAAELRRWCELQAQAGNGARQPTEAEITRPRRRAGAAGRPAAKGTAPGKRWRVAAVAGVGVVGLALLMVSGWRSADPVAALAGPPAAGAALTAGPAATLLADAPADTADTAGDGSAPGLDGTPKGALEGATADATGLGEVPAAKPAPTAAPRPVRPPPAAAQAAPAPVRAAAPTAPVAEGVVQLAISPWGEVQLDGRSLGTTPPLTRLSLPEGEHRISVRNADFPAHSVTVEVRADQPVTVRHRFGP